MTKLSIEDNDIILISRGLTMYAILDERRVNKENRNPIRIRITYQRKYKDFGTKQSANSQEWEKICGQKPKGKIADIKIIILGLLKRAFSIIQDVEPFNFTDFSDVYLNKKSNDRNNVYNWYDDKIKELYTNGQVGTAATYIGSKKSLQDFTKKDNLTFDEVTLSFLIKFEKWHYTNENSPTTVGIYLRPLRHVFNRAKVHNSKFITDYPFEKYKIPTPKNTKKALTKDQLKRIYFYEAKENSPEYFYKDIWLFSYFANGINMKDICQLKYNDIKGDVIEFRRAKTIRTNINSKPIVITLTADLKRIIEENGTKLKAKENYIFNFLKDGLDETEKLKIVKQATKRVNSYIKKIAINVGIEGGISTYTARHSYATILKNAGVSPSFIGESMGHSNIRTTESYLGSFETEQRKENVSHLSFE